MAMPAPRNQDTILPDILDVAMEHGIHLGKTLRSRPHETRANCPFCDDHRFHLYLNADKQVFKCYRCGESGGVVKFLAMLQNTSEQNVIEELKIQAKELYPLPTIKKTKQKRHPGTRLSVFQLRQIGYEYRPDWNKFFQEEPILAKQYADALWDKWQSFLEYEQTLAMRMLLLTLYNGTYSNGVKWVRNRSKEVGYDFLTPCLHAYSNQRPPKWYKDSEIQALTWMFGALEIEIEKELEKMGGI